MPARVKMRLKAKANIAVLLVILKLAVRLKIVDMEQVLAHLIVD